MDHGHKVEGISEDDDEEPDLNADDPIELLKNQAKKLKSDNNSNFVHPNTISSRSTAAAAAKLLKCKFCSYKASFGNEISRHEKRIHGFSRDKRPPPNLIPLQGKPSSPILKIPQLPSKRSITEDATPPVDEKEFNEMCKKSSLTSSLKEFVSLIGDEDGLKTIPDAKEEELETELAEVKKENFDTEEEFKKSQTDSLKRKNTTFFDKLKEKLVNGAGEDGDLICGHCGHESKCLSESVAHEKCHTGGKEEPVLTVAELSSTRCQHCRRRCKTSQDLKNHLKLCESFSASLPNEPPRTEKINVTLGNRVFVWNDIPSVKKEETEDIADIDMEAYDAEPHLECLLDEYDPQETPVVTQAPSRHITSMSRQAPQSMKKVFKCPHCSFWASTASRFHVHIVGHLNKKPFECSLCNYRSNWRWDITKHIRLKSARDPTHANATVNMTDETGRRNYSKYNKYLTMMKVHEPTADSSGSGRRTRACEATQGTVSEEDILGPITTPPHLNTVPMHGGQGLYGSAGHQAPLQTGQPSRATKRTLWKCKKCLFRNASKEKVLAHVKMHYGPKRNAVKAVGGIEENERRFFDDEPAARNPYKCGHCHQVSNWKHVIQRHCKLRHNGEVNIALCTEADKDLPSLDTKPASEAAGSNDEENQDGYACDICPFTTETAGDLTAHKLNHVDRPGSIFKCTQCPFYVPSKIAVLEHMEIHGVESVDNFTSLKIENFDPGEYCERGKGTENDFDKRYQCQQCPYVSNSKTQFLYHKQFHKPRDAPFKCIYCSYNVSRRHLLHQHLRVHHHAFKGDDEPAVEIEDELPDIPLVWVNKGGAYYKMYKCRWCPHLNIRRVNIQEHEKMHQDNCKLQCPDCSYTCNNPGVLSSHVKVHAGYYGEIRSLVDPTRSDAEQIQNLENAESVVEPEIVLKVDEDQHVEQSTPESSYYQSNTIEEEVRQSDDGNANNTINFCSKCPARFLHRKELKIHSKFHLIRLPFKCEFCSYTARQRPHLLAHLRVHGQEYQERTASLVDAYMVAPEYPRPKTTITSKESRDLAGPIWAVILPGSNVSDKKLKGKHACNLCPAKFFKSIALKFHITLHGSSHQHRCKYCDYSVKTYGNLIKHQLVHENTNERIIEPDDIDKSDVDERSKNTKKADPQFGTQMHGSPDFIYPTYLKNGKLKEKRYKCHKCPTAFEKRDQYRIHLLLHGAKQKYKCEKCDYSVKYYANYIQHVKKHEDNDDALKARGLKHDYKEYQNSDVSFTPQNLELTMIEKQTLMLERRQKQNRDTIERKVYHCDLCPYTNFRKDCFENHEKRHFKISGIHFGFNCPHCDYSSNQTNFLREHCKLHFKPDAKYSGEAYLKIDDIELMCTDENVEFGNSDSGYSVFKDTGVEGAERYIPKIPVNFYDQEEIDEDDKIYINPLTHEPINYDCDEEIVNGIEMETCRKSCSSVLGDFNDSDMNGEDLIEMVEEHLEVEKPKVKRLRGKNWRCKKCPHAFGKKDQFLRHIALHGSNQRYSCDICDYSVKFYTNYVQHMRMHQTNEPNRIVHIRQYVASPEGAYLQENVNPPDELNHEVEEIKNDESLDEPTVEDESQEKQDTFSGSSCSSVASTSSQEILIPQIEDLEENNM